MRHAYDNRVRYMNHEHTKNLVGRKNVLEEFILNVIGTEDDKTDEDSTTH
jgi:Mn-dependent DtxR family transcriptional regulator